VGSVLLREAANTVVNCSMELGGNAPFIVFDDADLDDAVAGAMIAKMRNGGEACTAANRFFVQDGIADAFSKKFAAAMQAMRVGPGLEEGVDLGPLINKSAQNEMIAFVDDATAKGAKVVTGGQRPNRKGFFFQPTLLVDVPDEANVLNREIFGPIAPVQRFSTTGEAIAKANGTPYGLISYVFTRDLAKGLDVAEQIESGMIGLNRGVVSDPAAPFGGVKQSGVGREGAHEGMLEFLEKKYIAVDW
jgi:succinate-semialdehyde dehydrogenase/glutarate-semialdehyde dehydrogenase